MDDCATASTTAAYPGVAGALPPGHFRTLDGLTVSSIGLGTYLGDETDELGGFMDNWFGPSVSCVLALCRAAGFARVTGGASPIAFAVADKMHPFAMSVEVRAQADGTSARQSLALATARA